MALLRDIVDRILFPNREIHSIPVLDGPFSPNARLDGARILGAPIVRPDDLAAGPDGALYVSSGCTILRCTGDDFESRTLVASFASEVGPLAFTRDGRLLAGVSGLGVVAMRADGTVETTLEAAGDVPLHCPTALAVGGDGSVFICDGSRWNRPEDWLPDLMQQRAPSGRLVVCDEALAQARTVLDKLAWPSGVAVPAGSGDPFVAEAWAHRLSVASVRSGSRTVVIKNFAGYPARLTEDHDGSLWMAFFGMRTQLIEFVLREKGFREAMMASVPRELWIGPRLGGGFDYRESTQIGRIKKLGIQKPWAPPRSYGLVARLDASGTPTESLHSRVDGQVHGVTAVRRIGDRVLAVSRGHEILVELPLEPSPGRASA